MKTLEAVIYQTIIITAKRKHVSIMEGPVGLETSAWAMIRGTQPPYQEFKYVHGSPG